ncbi:MAG: aldehyde dehydrogenase family protein, partial [bacterium]
MSAQTLPTAVEQRREIVSYDPASGVEIGRAPLCSVEEVKTAVERARDAQPAWAGLSFRERRRTILRARALLLDDSDEVAKLISR